MTKIYTSADQLIGNTPLLELTNLEKKLDLKAKVLAKLEYLNPAGSVKDRVAKAMIEEAQASGKLTKDSVIIEPTSGNTGIGLAAVAAAKGYRVIITMPETMSVERQQIMKAYGAEVILTEGAKGMQGAIDKAEALAEEIPGGIIAGQFVNPANPKAHFEHTGPEIYKDTEGTVDIFVAGIGTGGTITGTGTYLKQQGIGAGFVPEVLDTDICDEIICITAGEAFSAAREIGKQEGVLVGISSGAAAAAAFQLARRPENEGKRIVVILPDTGDRYLSTELFEK